MKRVKIELEGITKWCILSVFNIFVSKKTRRTFILFLDDRDTYNKVINKIRWISWERRLWALWFSVLCIKYLEACVPKRREDYLIHIHMSRVTTKHEYSQRFIYRFFVFVHLHSCIENSCGKFNELSCAWHLICICLNYSNQHYMYTWE